MIVLRHFMFSTFLALYSPALLMLNAACDAVYRPHTHENGLKWMITIPFSFLSKISQVWDTFMADCAAYAPFRLVMALMLFMFLRLQTARKQYISMVETLAGYCLTAGGLLNNWLSIMPRNRIIL